MVSLPELLLHDDVQWKGALTNTNEFTFKVKIHKSQL